MTQKQKLVLIGNGMAGMQAVEDILKKDSAKYDITVFGAEPHGNYNRIMLSPVLAGEQELDDIVIHSKEWYAENNITLHCGEKVTALDSTAKTLTTEKDNNFEYDKLIIATGSSPFIIPVPGKDLPGVISFRDINDVNMMRDAAKSYKNAVVIGGGLLGLEAAHGLQLNGMNVTVLHLMPTLMERQLDEAAGHLLQKELESRGINVITGADTQEIIGTDRVEAVRLKSGEEIPADLVVMAVGIRPNTELGQAAQLDVERGIVVDDHMQTSAPDVYAVGECVQHRGQCYGLVAPLYEMGRVLANNLCTDSLENYEGSITSTKLKVSGVNVFSCGEFLATEDSEDIVYRDPGLNVYKRLVIKDDILIGVVLYGDTADGPWYFQMIREQKNISDMRDMLIFGQAYATGGGQDADPFALISALPDEAEVCGCNGICKGDIVTAIQDKGLTTLAEVRSHTKASASCGSCTPQVEMILQATAGDAAVAHAIEPVCGCTTHGHDYVRQQIREQGLKSIPEVLQALRWSTPNGCGKCRPALNYYLLCQWPGEYNDDYQSRFINERAHANIQKDGTYSVVPRIWGGLTNANELRAIADVVDKFDIPTVKVTGGQRIDLLGVKKEDLTDVWADLNAAGMVSGHAYGKSLRTVKTCVGSEWCRFGTQAAMTMGIELEKLSWASWTPHKFKMAVSGCPRNCAEATIKDFGVVAVDSGWELHVGGNGGMVVRATDLLCKVETEEDVKEYCGAFMQLYREEGHYLERTAPYVERVGLDHIKAHVVENEESRKQLYQRFLISQRYAQIDPWAERARDKVHAHEFSPLAQVG
ncbi:MAG: nitrite reductase large subunit [Kordiimonas sp.]|nr:nitrite reductase large subunit [Kordiimonas sp.]|tara:strand:- start:784 stop:3231 length:2448 start_codon:yes stop_codon:yes gene_type:complete